MAASSKFDLSSSSSDGPPTHSSGQRVSASLERPGSFRDAAENRITTSLPSSSASRAGSMSSQGDAISFLQTLVSDVKTAFDQKPSRHVEVRRQISSIFGISQEGSLPATFTTRALPSSSAEEIRRLRNYLHESSVEASDRAKAFGEAALKMDKCYNSLSRKRSRTDISSSVRSNAAVPGGSTPKMGTQSHLTAHNLGIGPQKCEERAKSSAPNRKIRTSLSEMDARAASMARPSGSMERDVFKLANSSATPPEEKGRPLATAVDWDKSKTKKKRSVIKSDASINAALARPLDGDREVKRGMQQKITNEARPRLNSTHGFRSNGREENYAASPTSTVKMNSSVRGPRSNSGSLPKTTSPNMNRAVANSDEWEHSNSINKVNGVVGAVNRKRSASARSSSPPVAHWGGQRLQKMTRVARRSNLPPVGSNRDDFPASDMQDTMVINDDGLGFARRQSANASQQSKSRGDQVLCTGLSESEDSGVNDNKSKDKSRKSGEMEEKTGASIQKVATLVLPSRKSKIIAEEDQEDGVRRNGKISRVATPARSNIPASIEKLDGVPTAKQMRSARINYEKIESKPGRPLTKKLSERKGHTRPRHPAAGAPLEFTGESDDDHEELLAAAKAAINTREGLNEFWVQNEEIFGLLSAEDQEFLNQQIRLSDEAAASVCSSGDDQSLKANLEHNLVPSTPALSSKDGYDGSSNGTISLNERMRVSDPSRQSKHSEPFLEDLVLRNGAHVGVSICQALLSAIIEEEEIESFNNQNSSEEDHLYGNAYGLHFDSDAELKSKGLGLQSFGTFQVADRAAVYSYKANTGWGYHDELTGGLGSNGLLDELVPTMIMPSSPICTEFQYSQACISERILLELGEIGVYPEPVPCLAQSEDEDISEGINRLTAKLHEQVLKKKKTLLELEKAVTESRASQQRDLERIALDKLLGTAYEKYMACWGPTASGNKNMNRAYKQATLAFVRRTLARYRRFEETGTSCFSEPAFKDVFSLVSSRKDVFANPMDGCPLTSVRHSTISLADRSNGLASQQAQREDIHNKSSDAFKSVNHLTEQTCGREDHWSNKLKKKELLLDEVVGSATGMLRASPGLGGPLVSGTKGKRSERDGKGQSASRNGTAKVGRPASSNVKNERKNKPKPKQKMTQLSASVNGPLGKATEAPNKASPSAAKSRDNVGGGTKKDETGLLSSYSGNRDLANDPDAMDLCNLQLPEIDVGDFGGQGQDIGSWLNIEEDGLQDIDFMGLEIPMDDLSEVNMMF